MANTPQPNRSPAPGEARDPLAAKRQGEWTELCFAQKAMGLGLTVSKPFGESAAYDFVVDAHGRLVRVQVKSVAACDQGAYRISPTAGSTCKRPYTSADIDLLVAYVVPYDAWYLLPVESFSPLKTLRLAPQRPSERRFERFREAWYLLT